MNEINFNIEDLEEINLSMDVGIKEIYPPIENLEVTPTKEQQVFTHENSYGYDEVVVNAIPDEYIIPEGMLPITENKTYDVTKYARVSASVYPALNLQDKEVTPTREIQTITSDESYDGLNEVKVNAIPDNYTETSGTLDIDKNGTYDVKQYAEANVNIDGYKPIYISFKGFTGKDLGDTVAKLDTSELTSCDGLFEGDRYLTTLDLRGWNTSKVKSMSRMFYDCANLATIEGLANLNTSEVTTMSSMFNGCPAFKDWANVEKFNTGKVTTFSSMFQSCGWLTGSLNLRGWDVSNATDIGGMFYYCRALSSLDIRGWNTNKVTRASTMFVDCAKLSEIIGIEDFNFSLVKEFTQTFSGCKALTSLDLSKWGVSTATTSLYYMFYNCTGLTTLNLSGWDTSKVTNSQCVFRNCSALTTLILDTPNVFKITNANAFQGSGIESGICTIYVADALVDAYKEDTYFGVYANQIKGMSEYTG